MVGYTKELKDLLVAAGCEFVRSAKGDHEIWKSASGGHFTVDTNIKSRRTATLKQAGLKKHF